MEAKVINIAEWKAEHPPLVAAWNSATAANIRCWTNWMRLWFPWVWRHG